MRIPCTLMRGGTSKGILIESSDLPYPAETQDKILFRLMGRSSGLLSVAQLESSWKAMLTSRKIAIGTIDLVNER